MRWIVSGLAAGLILSLAANSWLIWTAVAPLRPPQNSCAPLEADAGGSDRPSLAPAVVGTRRSTCCAALARCRGRGWKLASTLLDSWLAGTPGAAQPSKIPGAADSPSGRRRDAPSGTRGRSPGPPRDAARPGQNRADPAAQARALCDIARDHLRRHFDRERRNILKSLAIVNDPVKMQRNFATEIGRLAKALGLAEHQIEPLRDDFSRIYFSNIRRFAESRNKKPANWRGMLAAATRLFRDQDRFVSQRFGAAGLTKYRLSQVKGRTAVMAILSRLAGVKWGRAMVW